MSNLFKSFGKLENTVLNPLGVGLGLYISNMLIHELGGNGLKVSSILGKGSTFTFQIPITPIIIAGSETDVADENSNISFPISTSTKLFEKAHILIVDDTYFNILAYFQIFTGEGIICDHAMNGAEAIEKVKGAKFDLILMDCEMLGMNGWETTIFLKELAAKGEINRVPPIIGTTAYDSESVKSQCIVAGMDDLLSKPCPKKDTIQKIMHWIEKSREF